MLRGERCRAVWLPRLLLPILSRLHLRTIFHMPILLLWSGLSWILSGLGAVTAEFRMVLLRQRAGSGSSPPQRVWHRFGDNAESAPRKNTASTNEEQAGDESRI